MLTQGITFYEDDVSITITDDSELHTTMAKMLKMAQNMGSLLNVSATITLDFCPISQPTALLVIYQITAGYDGSSMLCTTKGRAELRLFIVEHLFPRLKQRSDAWEEDTEDTDTAHECITEAFGYLHTVYIWLGHPPNHRWTQGSITLTTMAYLLEDDPEILLWDHRANVFHNISWAREPEFRSTLNEF